ncbi:putative Fe-S cluster assembly protein SufT [Thauera sp. 2A1]|uniref:putative Fe-S cluster assembly protein SufT n=1 Tax=Thauera sp. 2A1 TaxID=2570191 RepID=UPI001D17CF59|nr:putative Fe-S cluster assembly protein SufT [Thauera sp. 2A1]KAI5914500.1 putative Fe-S cluster assembly protein SufT [Thauera sp. 2A1]
MNARSEGTTMNKPMGEILEVRLTRDCPAVLVPWGSPVTLEAGEYAQVTQRLGGTFTVMVDGNLYRIAGSEADALGLEAEAAAAVVTQAADGSYSQQAVEAAAWDQLATCYDPEIPIDIVNLGLVYGCELTRLPSGRFRIDVRMTLTAPGCGMGMMIADEAKEKLEAIPGVEEVDVQLVWDPPWSREMMSEGARLEMGLL